MSRADSASDLACGCLFWAAVAAVVLILKALLWRAFIRWAVQ